MHHKNLMGKTGGIPNGIRYLCLRSCTALHDILWKGTIRKVKKGLGLAKKDLHRCLTSHSRWCSAHFAGEVYKVRHQPPVFWIQLSRSGQRSRECAEESGLEEKKQTWVSLSYHVTEMLSGNYKKPFFVSFLTFPFLYPFLFSFPFSFPFSLSHSLSFSLFLLWTMRNYGIYGAVGVNWCIWGDYKY